jgi:pseudaminic acid synthase
MKKEREIKIGKRKVGGSNPTFIVAEMSVNHKQSFRKAVEIIKAAASAGADAVKLQTFTPDTITLQSDKKWFRVGGVKNPKKWQEKTFHNLYKEAFMPWEWQPKLKKIAEREGLILFSTPFDVTAVDFLEKMKVSCYKIASYEATDSILLKKVASTGKPVILSVGFATREEINLAVSTLRKGGTKDIVLLYCLTSYAPTANPEGTNLRTMLDLKDRFQTIVGFSDNMGGIVAPALAAAMGASVIEKHFVLSHKDKTLDDRFSLDPREFKKMVDTIRTQEKLLGMVRYGPQTPEEKYNLRFRRSLFVVTDIKKGEKFTKKNIRSIRPADGLPTKFFAKILGKTAKKDIEEGTPLVWNFIVK